MVRDALLRRRDVNGCEWKRRELSKPPHSRYDSCGRIHRFLSSCGRSLSTRSRNLRSLAHGTILPVYGEKAGSDRVWRNSPSPLAAAKGGGGSPKKHNGRSSRHSVM